MFIIVSKYIIRFSRNLKGDGILSPSMWMGVPNVSGSSALHLVSPFW